MKAGMVRAFFRLFTVQAAWNFERLQGIGAAWAIEPLLRDLPGGPSGERYRDAMRRAATFFNSHPYLSGLAVGAVARAEHDHVPVPQIERLRSTLPAPLGAVGDRLFWAGVLPTTSGLGLALAATMPWAVGPAVFFVLYNVVHLLVRGWALQAGWDGGMGVARALGQQWLRTALYLAAPFALTMVGFALPTMGSWLVDGFTWTARGGVIAVAALGLVVSRWVMPTLSGLRFGLSAAGLALLVGWVWL
jgi:mannose/fructose/N-acetylgalactosamine-specific phosphotransferase system component IID